MLPDSVEHNSTDIQQLVQECLRNDRRAQKELYTQFYPYAMRVCLPYTRNQCDAEEVLSQAFIRIFGHLHQFDVQKGSLYGWIRQIVVHAALDHIRQHSRFSAATLEAAESIVIENEVVEKLGAAELLQAIRQLPAATGTVFNLYCIEGYNHREIAALLRIKEGTSKWHLSEARSLLQQRLNPSKQSA